MTIVRFSLYERATDADKVRDKAKRLDAISGLKWGYLGGPMNHIKDFNFPAFDDSLERVLCARTEVGQLFSPAENDRLNGFEGIGKSGEPVEAGQRRRLLSQDMDWIGRWSDFMVLLPGWESSFGARAEVAFHQGLHLPVYLLEDFLEHGFAAAEVSLLIPVASGSPAVSTTVNTNVSVSLIRKFETGADRDLSDNKPDYEGCLSPLALEAFAHYMKDHTVRKDGTLRSSDNWQKGIPLDSYMKSGKRHQHDWWKLHRGYPVHSPDDGHRVTKVEALCALLFNVQGYLHTLLEEDLRRVEAASEQTST